MRKAREVNFMENDGKFVGICLGADFVAEHEWGIQKLCSKFGTGTDMSICGVERHRIKHYPKDFGIYPTRINLAYPEKGTAKRFVLTTTEDFKYSFKEIKYCKSNELSGMWDGSDFLVSVNPEDKPKLELIYDAVLSGDACITYKNKTGFIPGGLCILIISALPESTLKEWKEMHEDQLKLEEASKSTGIHATLKEANKKYFALSPN